MVKSSLLLSCKIIVSFWVMTLIWLCLQLDHLIPYAIKPDIALALAWGIMSKRKALLGIFIGAATSTFFHISLISLDTLTHGLTFSLLHATALTLGYQLIAYTQKMLAPYKWYLLPLKSYGILLLILAANIFIVSELDILYFYFGGVFEEALVPQLSLTWYLTQFSGMLIITPYILCFSLRRKVTPVQVSQTITITFLTAVLTYFTFYGSEENLTNPLMYLVYCPFLLVAVWWQNVRAFSGSMFLCAMIFILLISQLYRDLPSEQMLHTFNFSLTILSLFSILGYMGMILIRDRGEIVKPKKAFTKHLPPSPMIALTIVIVGYNLAHAGIFYFENKTVNERKSLFVSQTDDFAQKYFRALKSRQESLLLLSNMLAESGHNLSASANNAVHQANLWKNQAQQLLLVYPDIEALMVVNQQLFVTSLQTHYLTEFKKGEHIRLFIDDVEPFFNAIIDNQIKMVALSNGKIGIIIPFYHNLTFSGFILGVIKHEALKETYTSVRSDWRVNIETDLGFIVEEINMLNVPDKLFNHVNLQLSSTQSLNFTFTPESTDHFDFDTNTHLMLYIGATFLNLAICSIIFFQQYTNWRSTSSLAKLKATNYKFYELKSTIKHLKEYYHLRQYLFDKMTPDIYKSINSLHGFIKKVELHESEFPNARLNQHLSSVNSYFLELKKHIQDIIVLTQEGGSIKPVQPVEFLANDFLYKLTQLSLLRHYSHKISVKKETEEEQLKCYSDEKMLQQALMIIIASVIDDQGECTVEATAFPGFHNGQRMVFFSLDFEGQSREINSLLEVLTELDTVYQSMDYETSSKFQLRMAKKLIILIRGTVEYVVKSDTAFSIVIKIPTKFN